MTYVRPPALLAGFIATLPEHGVPELRHVGEQWAPSSYVVEPHAHTTWEWYLQMSGLSRWRAEGEAYALAPGGFLAVPPGLPHCMDARPQSAHHFLFAALDLPPVLERLGVQPGGGFAAGRLLFLPQAGTLTAPFRHLIREVSLSLPERALGLRLALDMLVLEAVRLVGNTDAPKSRVAGHPAVHHARQLLEEHPGRAWRLADLARLCGLSANHLAECFTRDIGQSPHRYLLRVRLLRAQEMLAQSDIALTALALELGFSSGQHFAALFKRHMGETPRQYRQRAQPSAVIKAPEDA